VKIKFSNRQPIILDEHFIEEIEKEVEDSYKNSGLQGLANEDQLKNKNISKKQNIQNLSEKKGEIMSNSSKNETNIVYLENRI
jgi:hypothetical protein